MVATPLATSNEPSGVSGTRTSSIGSSAPRRRAFGELTAVSSSSSSSSNHRLGEMTLSVADAESVSSTPTVPSSNSRLAIFVDPSSEEAERTTGNPWPEVGTRKERIKENVRQPEKMNGTILKQRGAAKVATKDAERKAKSVPKIIPFRDPEPAPASTGPSKLPPKTPGKAPFKPFIDDGQTSSEKGDFPCGVTNSTIPATPRFTPFRDEVGYDRFYFAVPHANDEQSSTQTPAGAHLQTLPVPDTVMRLKAISITSNSNETEALRKDPFKNYKDL